MRSVRPFVALAALLLLGGLNLVPAADKVLVAGEVPLTQETVDLYHQMWEWYCDLTLTPEQRRQHTQLFITFWTRSKPEVTRTLLASYSTMEKDWRSILELKGAEQQRKRLEVRARWIANLRKKPDEPVNRFLLSIYDDAYKPGGSKNPILVDGDPPLTQGMVDVDAASVELLLDFRLTDDERQKYQRLMIAVWKQADQDRQRKWAKNLETWSEMPTWNNARRNEVRVLHHVKVREGWVKNPTDLTRWLLDLEQAACKPGSARNPVLVDAEPPLTQLVVDRYGDYLEFMVDLSVSGGFSAQEREILQNYLVKGWPKMSAAARKDLLADLKRWSDEAGRGGAAADECIRAMQPKVLAELRVARDDPLSQWLLAVRDRETELHKRNLARIKMEHEATMRTIDAMPTGRSGYWKYNSFNQRYEWVP
jgi:hypothetical protein